MFFTETSPGIKTQLSGAANVYASNASDTRCGWRARATRCIISEGNNERSECFTIGSEAANVDGSADSPKHRFLSGKRSLHHSSPLFLNVLGTVFRQD
jgi:hypothetical protein